MARQQRRCGGCENETARRRTAPHSITSSARSRIRGGIVRRRSRPVLRLTTKSNFTGSWMGKSAGLPCLVHRLEPGDLAVELGQVLPELPEPLRRAHRFFVALDLV